MSRTPRRITACVALVSFGLLATGCTERALAPVAPEQPHSYTGAELYQGLILGWGPVADEVPHVRDFMNVSRLISDREQLVIIERMQTRMIEGIAAADPEFFDRFAANIYSGDHFRIDAALKEGAAITIRALHSLPEIAESRDQLSADPLLRQHVQEALMSAHIPGADTADVEQLADLALAYFLAGEQLPNDPHVAPQAIVAWVFVAVAAVVAATWAAVVNWVGGVQVAAAALVAVTKIEVEDVLQQAARQATTGRSLFQDQMINSLAQWARN